MNKGKLYICPTPIGNLEDTTFRVLRVLKEADIVAAEDTRRTLRLLNYFEIQKPLISYHEHNEKTREKFLINKLSEGENIALVSDAGMPGISDPGEMLIKACIENDISFEVLPGATAGLLALVASGLSTGRFSFEGFLDRAKKKRKARLEKIKNDDRTLIFYESPHRITEMLEDCIEILGNRQAAIGRELTKKHEEYIRGNLEDLLRHFKTNKPKGEFVIVCEGINSKEEKQKGQSLQETMTIKEHILFLMNSGMDKKEAVKAVSKSRNLPRNEIYKEALSLHKKDN